MSRPARPEPSLRSLEHRLLPAPPNPLRIAIDADCPRCGYPERFFEPERGVFGCSSLNQNPCGYESTERNR